ncbi:MAG: ADOP family duplicated permease, partial [Longimicrobiales bacterium]
MSERESGSGRGRVDASRSERRRAPRPPDIAAETDAEMEFHVQARADAYVREGMSPDQALVRARAEFGDRERARAECVEIDERRERRRRVAEHVAGLRRNVRYALRRLRATPGFTIVAVLTLALGIGANSAIFSVVNGVLLRPLPFADADRLAMVWMDNQRIGVRTDITSWAAFEDWRAQNRSFGSMAGFARGSVNLAGDFEPERVAAGVVSADFFSVLGVQPILGRSFSADELAPGAARVAIIGHGVWTQRFGGAADVVGRTIRLNGVEVEVVGVMPAGFDFPNDAVVWTPLRLSDDARQARGSYFLYVVGRLADGVSIERAQADMDVVAAAQAEAYPANSAGLGIFVQPMRTDLVGDVRPALLVLLGAVGLVLLIACANVANLMLSRAAARQREMAVRLALGAGRGQLVRQLLTESVVLAVIGGGAGLAIAYGGVTLLRATAPADLPRLDEIAIDPVVLGFTLGLSVLTGVLFGLVPSLQSARSDQASVLRDESRSSVSSRAGWHTRGTLIVAELALSSILLVGAGLLVQSFVRLSRTESGFEASGVLTARIALIGPAYSETDALLGFYDRLFERLRALPGVQHIAAGTDVLLEELPWSGSTSVEGKPRESDEERIEVTFDVVTPGYFRAVGTPLVSGRDFGPEDRADGAPVAIVNQAMVRRYWPDEDPIGKRFKFGDPDSEGPWITVVGVSGDSRRTAPDRGARPSAYFPHRQMPSSSMMLLIRSIDDPLQRVGAVREAVRGLDPNQPLAELATLESMLAGRLAQRRLTTLLASVFAAAAIVLALVGVYAVLSYAVAQSTREIGVRIALGAEVADVLRMVFGRAGVLLAGGLGLGVLGAVLATRSLTSLLYEIDALDPLTFAAAPFLLGAVALLACYVPARR